MRSRIAQLECDLVAARELSSKQIAERIKLTEEKSRVMSQLAEATKLTTYLESQLRRSVLHVKSSYRANNGVFTLVPSSKHKGKQTGICTFANFG